jgi:hypothetical protein
MTTLAEKKGRRHEESGKAFIQTEKHGRRDAKRRRREGPVGNSDGHSDAPRCCDCGWWDRKGWYDDDRTSILSLSPPPP